MPSRGAAADLVFEARLGLLRHNLELVSGVYGAIANPFEVALPRADPAQQTMQLKTMFAVQQRTNEVFGAVFTPNPDMSEVRRAFDVLMADMQTMVDNAKKLVVVPQSPTRSLAELDDQLVQDAASLRDNVDALAESDAPSGDRWSELRRLEVEANDVFSEYVDLVRGAALRSNDAYSEVCRIADALVTEVASGWKSITIPARTERMQKSSGYLIRIGFPEWTIWTLPLAVHEYGHVYLADRQLDMVPLAATGRRESQILAADAFAAFTAGPAYACALFMSRLDPGDDGELTGRRAAVVLGALEDGAGAGEAMDFVALLRDTWTAIATDCACRVHAPTADDVALIKAVKDRSARKRFSFGEWLKVVDPIARRLAGEAVDDGEFPNVLDAREVLNGAWLARLGYGADPAVVEVAARQLALDATRSGTGVGTRTGGISSATQPQSERKP